MCSCAHAQPTSASSGPKPTRGGAHPQPCLPCPAPTGAPGSCLVGESPAIASPLSRGCGAEMPSLHLLFVFLVFFLLPESVSGVMYFLVGFCSDDQGCFPSGTVLSATQEELHANPAGSCEHSKLSWFPHGSPCFFLW